MRSLKYCILLLILFSVHSFSQTLVPLPNDISAVSLELDDFTLKEYNIDPEENSGYWFVYNDKYDLNISITFERAPKEGDSKVCRDYYVKSLNENSKIKMSSKVYLESDNKSIYEYLIEEYNGKVVNQKNINVYMVNDHYWVDLHISKMMFEDEDKIILDKFVKSAFIKTDFKYSPMHDLAYGSLFFNRKNYSKAALFYQKALTRYNESGKKGLEKDYWRVLIDQLAMSYGISGRLENAKIILESGIKEDPGYPMFYYNLACVYAESNDYNNFIETLSKAIKYRNNMISGEVFPDPNEDSSFEKYKNDKKFKELISDL